MANRRPIVLAGGQPVELPPADTLSVGSAIIGASPVTALSISSDAGTGETFVDSGLGSFGISFRAKLDGGGRFRWYNNAGNVKLAELGSAGLTLLVPAFLGDVRVSNGANTGTIAFGASGNGPYLAATDSGVNLATGSLPFNITGPFGNNTNPIYVGAVNATTAAFSGGATFGGSIVLAGVLNFGTRGGLQIDDNGTYLDAKYQHVLRTTATGSNVVVASFRPDTSYIQSNLSVSGTVTSASGSQVRGPSSGETFLELLQPGVKSWSVGMKAGDAALYLGEGTGMGLSSFKFAPGGTFTANAATVGGNTLGSSGISTVNITATGIVQVAGTVQALNVLSTGSGAQIAFNSRDASGLGWLWYSGIESTATLYHSTQGDVFQFNKNGLFTARGGGQFGARINVSHNTAEDVSATIYNISATGYGPIFAAGGPNRYSLRVQTYNNTDLLVVDAVGTSLNTPLAVTGPVTAPSVDAPNLRDRPPVTTSASRSLALTDRGKLIDMVTGGNTLTIPQDSDVAFPVGTTIVVTHIGSGANLIVPAANVVLVLLSGSSSISNTNVSMASSGVATLVKRSSNYWLAYGSGLSAG